MWSQKLLELFRWICEAVPLELQKEFVRVSVFVVADSEERHGVCPDGTHCRVTSIFVMEWIGRQQIRNGHVNDVVAALCMPTGPGIRLLVVCRSFVCFVHVSVLTFRPLILLKAEGPVLVLTFSVYRSRFNMSSNTHKYFACFTRNACEVDIISVGEYILVSHAR